MPRPHQRLAHRRHRHADLAVHHRQHQPDLDPLLTSELLHRAQTSPLFVFHHDFLKAFHDFNKITGNGGRWFSLRHLRNLRVALRLRPPMDVFLTIFACMTSNVQQIDLVDDRFIVLAHEVWKSAR